MNTRLFYHIQHFQIYTHVPESVPADCVRLREFLEAAISSLSLESSFDAEGAFASIKNSFPNMLSLSRLGNERTLKFNGDGKMSVPKV